MAWLFVLLSSLGLPGCRESAPADATPELHDLGSLQAFRAAFEADRGTTRLVLLLSPT